MSNLLPSLVEVLLEIFQDGDGGWPQSHQEQRWKNKKYKWKDQLDRGFGGLLLDLLAAMRPQRIRVDAQRFGGACAELF